MELTKSELAVMDIIWKAGKPLSRSEIIELAEGASWQPSSIHILLNGLLKKGAIKEAGFVRSGKTFGRLYASNIPCEEYYVNTVLGGRSSKTVLPLLFSAMIKSDEVSPELIDELETMLQQRRRELDGE